MFRHSRLSRQEKARLSDIISVNNEMQSSFNYSQPMRLCSEEYLSKEPQDKVQHLWNRIVGYQHLYHCYVIFEIYETL